jgi:hypothetical protein
MPVIGGLEAVIVHVERVRVLHQELAAAQDPGTRTGLVAVLGLDLVRNQRKVLVGAVLPLDRQREQLLVGGREQVVVATTVLKPEQAVAVFGPPVGHLIRSPWEQRGEQNLLSANGIHLVADDTLDPAQHPQPEWQPAVQPRPDWADVAGPDQQLVARHLGVGRVVAQGAQEQLGHAGDHRRQP